MSGKVGGSVLTGMASYGPIILSNMAFLNTPQKAIPVRSYIFGTHPEVFANNFRSIQTLHSCHRCRKGSRVYITKHPLQITLKIDEYIMGSAYYRTEVGCSLNSAGQSQKGTPREQIKKFLSP